MKSTLNLAAVVQAATSHEPAFSTLDDLARLFDAAHPCAPVRNRIKRWLDAFAGASAWSVTPEQVHAIAEALLAAGYKGSYINRDVSSLGSLFKWARQRRYAPRGFISPTISFVRYPEAIRHVEVTAEELDLLRTAAKLDGCRAFYAYVLLLMDTGARKSELLERTWADIDGTGRRILLKTSKTGKPRYLFYTEATGKVLEALRKADAGFVFAGRHGGPTDFCKRWHNAVAAIGRPDLRQHDMRHAAAAGLLRAGVGIAVAAQVLGHSSLILQRRYGHLETQALQAAQEQRWAAA